MAFSFAPFPPTAVMASPWLGWDDELDEIFVWDASLEFQYRSSLDERFLRRAGSPDHALCSYFDRVSHWSTTSSGEFEMIVQPEPDLPAVRFNVGLISPHIVYAAWIKDTNVPLAFSNCPYHTVYLAAAFWVCYSGDEVEMAERLLWDFPRIFGEIDG